jgi:hypothetical protein
VQEQDRSIVRCAKIAADRRGVDVTDDQAFYRTVATELSLAKDLHLSIPGRKDKPAREVKTIIRPAVQCKPLVGDPKTKTIINLVARALKKSGPSSERKGLILRAEKHCLAGCDLLAKAVHSLGNAVYLDLCKPNDRIGRWWQMHDFDERMKAAQRHLDEVRKQSVHVNRNGFRLISGGKQ